jgi:CRP-like cAMP-binding protein
MCAPLNPLHLPAFDHPQVAILVKFLAKVHHFKTLEAVQLRDVARAVSLVQVAAGTPVFRQGDTGDAYYIVLVGHCAVYLKDGSEAAAQHELGKWVAALAAAVPRWCPMLPLP